MTDKIETHNSPARWWPIIVFLVLLVAAVPWYWPDSDHSIIFGVPAWVALAVLVSLFASIFTAWLLFRPWPGESTCPGPERE
jgi:hypothetical protein